MYLCIVYNVVDAPASSLARLNAAMQKVFGQVLDTTALRDFIDHPNEAGMDELLSHKNDDGWPLTPRQTLSFCKAIRNECEMAQRPGGK
jgi:hypothetical protein